MGTVFYTNTTVELQETFTKINLLALVFSPQRSQEVETPISFWSM